MLRNTHHVVYNDFEWLFCRHMCWKSMYHDLYAVSEVKSVLGVFVMTKWQKALMTYSAAARHRVEDASLFIAMVV